MQFDHVNGIPLYVQIREQLRVELAQMEPGQAIPVEAELEKRFGASRITIRRAVDDLATEGLLVRQQGRGTFAQRPKFTHELDLITSWTDQLRSLGLSPKTSHRKITHESAPRDVAELLRLHEKDEVIRISRIRLAGRERVSYMINYLSPKLVPNFTEKEFKEESLYDFLRVQYNLQPSTAVDIVGTRIALKDEADELRIEHNSPVLTVRRVSYLHDGTPLELALVASRGDRYQYQVTLRNRQSGSPDQGATQIRRR